jgi:hypothetical protein
MLLSLVWNELLGRFGRRLVVGPKSGAAGKLRRRANKATLSKFDDSNITKPSICANNTYVTYPTYERIGGWRYFDDEGEGR